MAQTRDAVRYVRDELCMPQTAARLLDEIEEAVSSLSSMPSLLHELPPISHVQEMGGSSLREMGVFSLSAERCADSSEGEPSLWALQRGGA